MITTEMAPRTVTAAVLPAAATSDLVLRERLAAHRREQGRFADAYLLYAQTAALMEAEDAEHASRLWNNAGVCALRTYDSDRAAECFRYALEATMNGQRHDGRRMTRLYANLTAALHEGGRVREAWDAARQALLLAEESGDAAAEAQALYNLGLAERYLGEFGEAVKLFTAARRRYLDAGDPSRAADALHNIGWVYVDQGDLDAGEIALRRAREEKAERGEPVARIDLELARVSLLRQDWLSALAEAVDVAEGPAALVDPMTRLQALTLAAEAARHDDLDAALSYAAAALQLGAKLGRPSALFDLLPVLVSLRAEAGESLTDEEQDLAREMYERRHGVQGQMVPSAIRCN